MENFLIESALWLTGKKMEDMEVIVINWPNSAYIENEFSIEKFCYYLLSPEFIDKYRDISKISLWFTITDFWFAIYEYQSGKEQPLINLLSNIK